MNTFELASLTPTLAAAAAATARTMITKKITGQIDFTADAVVAE